MNEKQKRSEVPALRSARDSRDYDVRSEVLAVSEAGGISTSDIAHDKRLRATYRQLARDDLYFLTKAVLGYPDLIPHFHKPYAAFIQDLSKRKTLDLMPRSTYKTTVGTIGFAIWYLLNRPDDFVLIANQTAGNAERMLWEISQHFEGGNPMVNWLFPEYVKPGERWKPWNSQRLTFPARKLKRGTPSISTIGVGGKAESNHFHCIINDDLIGLAALESDLVMQDAISWHDYSVSLFVKMATGIERVHGTRWSMSDLYATLIADGDYEVYQEDAVGPDGESRIPELIPTEELRRLREKNFTVYMSQYMNNPMNPEALDFQKSWLNDYKLVKTEKGPACDTDGTLFYVHDMDVQLFVDPAGSGDVDKPRGGRLKKANNAVMIWGLHGSGRYFLLDCWTGRGRGDNPERQVAIEMLKMFLRWKGYVRKGNVEAYGAQRALITVFNMVCREEGYSFPMEEIGRGNTKAKKVRIRSYIGPAAQNGQIYVRKQHDQFIMEFSMFPQSDTFDTLDASAWAFLQLKRPPGEADSKMRAKAKKKRKQLLLSTRRTGY